MDLIKDILGGTDDSAQKYQMRTNQAIKDFAIQQAQIGRNDVARLFPRSDLIRNQMAQQALNVLSGTMPEQLRLRREGNLMAQNSLLAGLPQFENAILGGPVDYSVLRARAPKYDDSLYKHQIRPRLLAPQGQPEAQPAVDPATIEIARLLGGQIGIGGRR